MIDLAPVPAPIRVNASMHDELHIMDLVESDFVVQSAMAVKDAPAQYEEKDKQRTTDSPEYTCQLANTPRSSASAKGDQRTLTESCVFGAVGFCWASLTRVAVAMLILRPSAVR